MLVLNANVKSISSIVFSQDSQLIYTGSDCGYVHVWQPDGSCSVVLNPEVISPPIVGLAIRPDTNEILVATANQMLKLMPDSPAAQKSILPVLPSIHPDYQIEIVDSRANLSPTAFICPNRDLLIFASGQRDFNSAGVIEFKNLNTLKNSFVPVGERKMVLQITSQLQHSTQTKMTGAYLDRPSEQIRNQTGHNHSRQFAWATNERKVVIKNLAEQSDVKKIYKDQPNCICISPLESVIAVGIGWKVHRFDFKRKQDLLTFTGHKGRVSALAYLPDGRLLSASWDGLVRLWDQNGIELRCFNFDCGQLSTIAISPDGYRAVVGSMKGQIAIWDLE